MSKQITYLDETNPNVNKDILTRKEFQLYNPNNKKTNLIPRFLIKNAITKGDYLEIHSYQLFVKNYLNPNTKYSRLLIKWETGLGKCMGFNTPILMHDGSIKKVQDIQVGDLLMGDDSTPRKVLSLARGVDKMYDIIPTEGDKHTVNQEHVLCLKCSDKPDILEISVKDYLELDNIAKSHLKVYKLAVDFPEKELPFDPYVLGYWLGDKYLKTFDITSQDPAAIQHFAKNLTQRHLNTLKNSDLINYRHIPHIYKCNSRENRLKLLAGLIDSDASYANGCFEFTKEYELLMNDVIYLCQSLGFACHKQTKNHGESFKICISGKGTEDIPTLISRKKVKQRAPTKDVLVSEFEVKYVNEDNYYGFTLDGNHRYLLGDFTVTHNTVGALSIALNFITYYQKQEEYLVGDLSIGSVFILGFTQQIFRDELFKYPEFGFISRDELYRLNKIKKQAYLGNIADIENLKKFNTMLKKRLQNRKGNGFFKFIGYKELTNHLFISKEEHINLHSLSDDALLELIKSEKIILNKELLSNFANSLLICDEIHNVYNSTEKNNWGVAIQTILNHHKSCRAVFLSATPLNNSPTEVVDLLNLLLPRQYYNVIEKKDIFDKNENLLKNKEEDIKKYFTGRISYIRNRNPEHMASKTFIGEPIPGIDYLKFIRCPMSKFQYNTYKAVMENKDTLGQDGQYLLDFSIPNPDFKNPFNELGLYKSKEIREQLSNASQQWKNSIGISYNSKKDIILGHALKKDNLEKISMKYKTMLDAVLQNIKNKKGKMFIYHNNIHISGTLFIQEIFYQNGIIGEFDNSSDSTICAMCGDIRKNHSKEQLLAPVQGGTIGTAIDKVSIVVEDKYVLLSDSFDRLYNDQDVTLFRDLLIDELKSMPIVIEISKQDTDYIKLLTAGFSSYVGADYIYFYSPQFFSFLNTDEQWREYLDTIITPSKVGGNKNNRKHSSHITDTHIYYPARFVIVHSNLDKRHITQSLEKYNHINNIDGSKYMILIGSKIIKESHSMNSVRHIMVMSRPDNISTLIQIIGRAVRLNSHKLLQPKQRNVTISIFTSSLRSPKPTLSYEEKKYKEKIATYKVIQKIEKIMHENAIDAYFNYDNIWKESDEDKNFGLAVLPYKKPVVKTLLPHELNLSTFNTFYAKDEVEYIMYMIKKLFIEYSSAWTYADLYNALKAPPFYVEINTNLVSTDLYNIALNNLLFNNSVNYSEPKLQKLNNTLIQSNLLDKVRNPDDKIFIERMNTPFILTHMGEFYIMVPFINDEITNNVEVIYRDIQNIKPHLMNITDYLKYDMTTNYNEKKNKFMKKWETVSINHLELAMCDFGVKFHQEFIEEIIEYIFNVWTNPNIKKNEYHNFYIKMLYYYDLQKLISWAHTVNDTIKKKYTSYILPVTNKVLNKSLLKDLSMKENKETSGFINLLISSINKNDPYWISTGMVKEYENRLKITNALFDGLYKKSNTVKKIHADLLPVGHFLTKIPRFYIPKEGWRDDPTYSFTDKLIKENSTIVGYDSRSKTGLSVKFKLRSPIQNIKQHKDSRLIEKGAICSTKSKSFLREIAKKLDIDMAQDTFNVDYLCQQIRAKLIYNELKSRISPNPVRWFYFVYENIEF
jgi:hypothetical protein